MKTSVLVKTLLLLLASLALGACGGGGGSSSDSAFTPQGIRISASPTALTLNTNSALAVVVRVTQPSGAPIADGTSVTGTVGGVGVGNLAAVGSAANDQRAGHIHIDRLAAVGSAANGLTANGTTSGGNANFIFQSGAQTGTTAITFSLQDPVTPGRTVSTTVNVAVNQGPASDPRISFQPQRTQIPVNSQGIGFFIGSPFVSEVIVNVRSASGQAINDDGKGPQAIQFSISPSALGSVSVPDDPETDDINELYTAWISIFDGVSAGISHAYVWSEQDTGTLTLTAAFTDPDTNQRVQGSIDFQIVSTIPPLPANIEISPPSSPIYIRNSGGNTFGNMQIALTDGSGQLIPDPVAGNTAYNNLQLEIVNADGDAVVAATNAQGQDQEARKIFLRTFSGIANAVVRAGNEPDTYTVRATADRADNNVDNGITDAVERTINVGIGDGRLFDIEITQPTTNALFINTVTVHPSDEEFDIPPDPDGTYSLVVSAIATDRIGNPVLPGTLIRFGLIDEPQVVGFGDFQIAGGDGNPQESGTLFTAPTGHFTTAGGGAGPGDTLVVFGEEVQGNRDLESARQVVTVNSATSLTVDRRFNRNDDTGVSVDYGNILPYIVGRAADGNITAQGTTNDLGVVTTQMNYPVSRLGKTAIIWAQGEGDVVNNTPETVTDVEGAGFAGVAPATLVASPGTIPGNTTQTVVLCIYDHLQAPVANIPIGFEMHLQTGAGNVDGNGLSGSVDHITGADGCTEAIATTTGVIDNEGVITFYGGGDSADVAIEIGSLVLQATPSALGANGGVVTLTLRDSNGAPVPGTLLVGECETSTEGATVALTSGPGVTNASGQTTATITASNLSQPNEAGSGECTFSTATGEPSVTVTLQGVDICTTQFSPPPEGCTSDTTQFTLTVVVSGGGGSVSSTPAGITCTKAAGAPAQTCTADFDEGTSVDLNANPSQGVQFTGSCDSNGMTVMTSDRTCNVAFP